MKINSARILEHKQLLENHSLLVTNTIQDIEDLRVFMSHHVYAVWDFMSLLKNIQHELTPSGGVWLPTKGNRTELARMINEIVLCEETDKAPGGGSISHFDLYLQAMEEVGSDTTKMNIFLSYIARGQEPYFICESIPGRNFMKTTFDIIKRGPHCTAAAFAYGRETVIPSMFSKILNQLEINEMEAPRFHYYLERHIEVDGEEHGPMSESLVDYFIDNDPIRVIQAENAAIDAIKARIQLFDDIESELNSI